jgi:hypothetical protein
MEIEVDEQNVRASMVLIHSVNSGTAAPEAGSIGNSFSLSKARYNLKMQRKTVEDPWKVELQKEDFRTREESVLLANKILRKNNLNYEARYVEFLESQWCDLIRVDTPEGSEQDVLAFYVSEDIELACKVFPYRNSNILETIKSRMPFIGKDDEISAITELRIGENIDSES